MNDKTQGCQLNPEEKAVLLNAELGMWRAYKRWLAHELIRAQKRHTEARRQIMGGE